MAADLGLVVLITVSWLLFELEAVIWALKKGGGEDGEKEGKG